METISLIVNNTGDERKGDFFIVGDYVKFADGGHPGVFRIIGFSHTGNLVKLDNFHYMCFRWRLILCTPEGESLE